MRRITMGADILIFTKGKEDKIDSRGDSDNKAN